MGINYLKVRKSTAKGSNGYEGKYISRSLENFDEI